MTDHRSKNQRSSRGLPVTALVEGTPLQAEGQKLVPVVRLTSRVKRRASLEGEGMHGQGHGFVHMKPVAILVTDEDGEQRHQIHNETARIIGSLALLAVFVPGISALLIRLFLGWDN